MNSLDSAIISKILKVVKSHSIYGFKLLSLLKESNPDLNGTKLYFTLQKIKDLELVEPFISKIDKGCRVKIKYRLSEKGEEYLKSE